MRSRIVIGLMFAGACATGAATAGVRAATHSDTPHLTMRNAALSVADDSDVAADMPVDARRPNHVSTVDYIFADSFELPLPYAADLRFSLMWISSDGSVHTAAIRGDGSIRDTDDPGLELAHVGVGHFCIIPTDVQEGIVGVAQGYGGPPVTIDVTMGIGNPCPQELDARVSVQTWVTP